MTATADVTAEVAGAAVELRRAGTAVRVSAGMGAPVVSFVVGDHDWCAAGPWYDYAPTADACELPSFVGGVSRVAFPAGGLLALDTPMVDVMANGVGTAVTALWPPSVYPLTWQRTIAIDADGALATTYVVRNEHVARLPFVWGSRLALEFGTGVTLDIVRGARSRVARAHGEGLSRAGTEFAWPALRDGGRLVDLTRPASLEPRRAALCFVELARARFVVRAAGASLEIVGDAGVVTHAHLWVNNDADGTGGAPRRWWQRRRPRTELVVGPSVGAPSALSDAVGAWRGARWLDAGETLRWTVRYRPFAEPQDDA